MAELVRQHRLKLWPSQFMPLFDGRKRHEWRQNDRDFAVDDELVLLEYEPHRKSYTGRLLRCRVTWLTQAFGVPPGWCVMTVTAPKLDYECPGCGGSEVENNSGGETPLMCADCGHEIGPRYAPSVSSG